MSVSIKSAREIELMRAAGKILAKVHENLGKELKVGMSTWEIDRLGDEIIRSYGCIPSFKNYNGYPASVCVSVNDEVSLRALNMPEKETICMRFPTQSAHTRRALDMEWCVIW